jgi:Lrp/AsnC family leucine-responsive transcriptional regulator
MDYLLHVVSEDLAHYSRFPMGRLLKLDGVANVKSSFMLQSLKYTTELPLARIAR